MKKKLLCTALAAVMVLGLCACGGDEQPAGDNNGESTATGAAFKLGGTGPLTGSAAIYGVAAKNGAQIAVDEINALGETSSLTSVMRTMSTTLKRLSTPTIP